MKMIPYGQQSINKKDVQEVVKVLKSGWISQGPKIGEFERALAKYCKAKYAVAVSSGTAALHLAYLAAGIKRGDEIITSPMTFVATSNAALYAGATPIFADIQPQDININPTEIVKHINKKTRALVPVHFTGQPCDMREIKKIAVRHKLIVIEDGAHALGAGYRIAGKEYKVGSCSHSDMCIFSFHPVKSITTGEGGAITTNNKDIYEKLIQLRAHGVVRDGKKFINKNLAFEKRQGKACQAPWYYEVQNLGFNYRITDIQCALGISQLSRLDSFIGNRTRIAKIYNKAFSNLEGLKLIQQAKGKHSAHHLYVIQFELKKIKKTRMQLFEELKRQGLGVQIHYLPVPLNPIYQGLRQKKSDYPNAIIYYEAAVSIPIFSSMTPRQVKQVIRVVTNIVQKSLKSMKPSKIKQTKSRYAKV